MGIVPDLARGGDTAALRSAALMYHRRGWSIIGVAGKRPVGGWKRFQTRRPDEDELLRVFDRPSITGLAVIAGRVSGQLTVRDFDVADAYHTWAAQYPELPRALPTVQTSRGFHVYFRSKVEKIIKLGDGELRGNGYCLLPPSKHPQGAVYEWTIPLTDDELPIIDPHLSGLCNAAISSNEGDGCSVSAPSSASSVLHAIESTQPLREGERNRRLFDLARKLKADLPGASLPELRPLIVQWHERALPIIRTKPFSDTWADFAYAWQRIRFPAGEGTVEMAYARAIKGEPLQRAKDLFPGEVKIWHLASLCRELADDAGEFFLDVRTAGRLLEVDHTTAWRWLKILCVDGILRVEEVGSRAIRKASRYTFLG